MRGIQGKTEKRPFAAAVAALAVIAFAGFAPAAHGAVTIGSTAGEPDSNFICTCTVSQAALPGGVPTASPVNGRVVAWSVRSAGGEAQLRILEPVAGGAAFPRSTPMLPINAGLTQHAADLPISIGDRIGVHPSPPTNLAGITFTPVAGAVAEYYDPSPPDGTSVAPAFRGPDRIFLDATIEPDSDVVFEKVKPRRNGRVRLRLSVPNPGDLVARAKGALKRVELAIDAPGVARFILKPTKAARRELASGDRVKARIRIRYTPTFGTENVETRNRKLKR